MEKVYAPVQIGNGQETHGRPLQPRVGHTRSQVLAYFLQEKVPQPYI